MKFDITFHIVKTGVNIAGFYSPETLEDTPEGAKELFDTVQRSIINGLDDHFLLYPRDTHSMLGNPEFRSVITTEIIVTREFYRDAIVNMQLFEVLDGEIPLTPQA